MLGSIGGRLTGGRRSNQNPSQKLVEGLRETDGILSDTSEEIQSIKRDEGR